MAVHQNHDYAHQPHGVRDEADVWSTEEARQNLTMAGGYARAFSAYDATHVLTQRGVRRTVTPYHLYRKLALLSVSRPPLRRLVDLMRRAAQRYPVVRRLFLWRINS